MASACREFQVNITYMYMFIPSSFILTYEKKADSHLSIPCIDGFLGALTLADLLFQALDLHFQIVAMLHQPVLILLLLSFQLWS